jgi:hypothetical protein
MNVLYSLGIQGDCLHGDQMTLSPSRLARQRHRRRRLTPLRVGPKASLPPLYRTWGNTCSLSRSLYGTSTGGGSVRVGAATLHSLKYPSSPAGAKIRIDAGPGNRRAPVAAVLLGRLQRRSDGRLACGATMEPGVRRAVCNFSSECKSA